MAVWQSPNEGHLFKQRHHTMSNTVYKNYDQTGLDREYDNRGKVENFDEFMKLYAAESAKTRQRLDCKLDVAFGASAAETLDIFFPPVHSNASKLPLQVFFHGGYWKALNKSDFSFVANGFAAKNAITIVVNYALIPTVDLSELVEQCRRSLAWIWHNAKPLGGDRERIFISGHSAGGHLVGMMMATDWAAHHKTLPINLIKGGCGISGLYDLDPIRLCFLNDDLKLSEQDVFANSPVNQQPGSGDLMLPLGALEGDEYLSQSHTLADAWKTQTSQPSVIALAEHDHFSIVWELHNPQAELTTMIHRQMGM